MLGILLVILFTLIVLLLTKWIWKRSRHMSLLSRHGIAGPKSDFFFGNLMGKEGISDPKTYDLWFEKYGKVVGFYFGYTPMVAVNDADFIKQVCIKDFTRFPNRMDNFSSITGDGKDLISLSFQRNEKWKEMRQILSPAFSSAKLKAMFPLIQGAIETFVDEIGKHSKQNEKFNIHPMFNNLAMDIIARTAFGIKAGIQDSLNHPFAQVAKKTFTPQPSLIALLQFCFPECNFLITPLRQLSLFMDKIRGKPTPEILYKFCRNTIEQRRKNASLRRKDLLQLMLDAKQEPTVNKEKEDSRKDESFILNNEISEAPTALTEDEIEANAFGFLAGGYVTTGDTLAFAAHYLVTYPIVQEKCRQEALQHFDINGNELNFDALNKLQYIECVINETLRLHPPAINFVNRAVEDEDYTFGGITIPKGACVMTPIYQLHHDPDLWSDPQEFEPERFSRENLQSIHAAAFQPFGIGPRNCIAMRLALIIMKFTLASILIKYKLVPCSETEVGGVTVDYNHIGTRPKYGVFIKAISI